MALLVAGTNSGCGKSTVTLGLMAALNRAGRRVQPFKAGPDFIDPGLHELVTGRVSRNLDLWMCGQEYVKEALLRHSSTADSSVIEGVMGYFDGAERSTAALARVTGAKVVLVVDAYGMAESAAAIVEGFRNFSSGDGAPVDAVIFNRVGSERHLQRLTEALKGVEVLGALPREAEFSIPERHLGLMVAEEAPISDEAIEKLAATVKENIDIDRVAELAGYDGSATPAEQEPVPGKVRIAVARDRAFSFYYEDNLDALRNAGAEIIEFSPLKDNSLPVGVDGVYLGGGYPEMFSNELSENSSMREHIRTWAQSGGSIYAECGGLMYLGRGITMDGINRDMCGVFPMECELMGRRSALGYREIELAHDHLLGPRGTKVRGHEFHYSKVISHDMAEGVRFNVLAEDTDTVKSASYKNTLASYTHLHWGSRRDVAAAIVDFMSCNKIKET